MDENLFLKIYIWIFGVFLYSIKGSFPVYICLKVGAGINLRLPLRGAVRGGFDCHTSVFSDRKCNIPIALQRLDGFMNRDMVFTQLGRDLVTNSFLLEKANVDFIWFFFFAFYKAFLTIFIMLHARAFSSTLFHSLI